jgi:dihydropyrimidine dehydrogenase (NAD+) subunit PreA
MIAKAFEVGWAGAVVKTLIGEPVKNLQNRFASIRLGDAVVAFENIELLSEMTPDEWYRHIRWLKERFPEKVLIGSVMGDARAREQWLELARGCQDAGADMVELNFSCPHGYPERGKGSAIGQDAEFSARITGWLKDDPRVTIPIIPKLTAAVADIAHIGVAVAEAGAHGICAINTFPSIMGFDLKTLQPRPPVSGCTTPGGYSGPGLKPIALRCVSDLVKRPGLPVMACGGVSTGYDAAEFLLVGAPVVQVCTAIMLRGRRVIASLQTELRRFMGWHGFSAVTDVIGIGAERIRAFSELDGTYAVKPLVETGKCDGCGDCFVACRDAGFQAIWMDEKTAVVSVDDCTGCSLCAQVCPTEAISMVEV